MRCNKNNTYRKYYFWYIFIYLFINDLSILRIEINRVNNQMDVTKEKGLRY